MGNNSSFPDCCSYATDNGPFIGEVMVGDKGMYCTGFNWNVCMEFIIDAFKDKFGNLLDEELLRKDLNMKGYVERTFNSIYFIKGYIRRAKYVKPSILYIKIGNPSSSITAGEYNMESEFQQMCEQMTKLISYFGMQNQSDEIISMITNDKWNSVVKTVDDSSQIEITYQFR